MGLLILSPSAFACCLALFSRKRRASAWTVAVFAFSLALILNLQTVADPYLVSESLTERSPFFGAILSLLGPGRGWLLFFAYFSIFVGVCSLLFSKPSTEWLGIRTLEQKYVSTVLVTGRLWWSQALRIVFLAAVAWWLMQYLDFTYFLTYPLSTSLSYSVFEDQIYILFEWVDLVFPFLVPCAIFVWSFGEGLAVDSRGIRLVIPAGDLSILAAPWKRIRRIDFVNHRNLAPSAVIHYRGRFGLPQSFAVHAEKYSEGSSAIRDIRTEARRRGVQTTDWHSPDEAPLVATLLVAAGALAIVYSLSIRSSLWGSFVDDLLPLARFHEIAAPSSLAVLHLGAAACFGAALGVLSAFHQAGPRPFLLALWLLIGVMTIPDPLLHWLSWMAVYAILIARPGQSPHDVVSILPSGQIELGMLLTGLAPLISGLAYVLGIVLTCRKLPVTAEISP